MELLPYNVQARWGESAFRDAHISRQQKTKADIQKHPSVWSGEPTSTYPPTQRNLCVALDDNVVDGSPNWQLLLPCMPTFRWFWWTLSREINENIYLKTDTDNLHRKWRHYFAAVSGLGSWQEDTVFSSDVSRLGSIQSLDVIHFRKWKKCNKLVNGLKHEMELADQGAVKWNDPG